MKTRILLCLAALLCATPAFGQDLGSAALSGDVTDPAGAAVAGAEVTATSKATAVARSTTTTSSGLFVLNQLAPGDYDVRIASKGFGPTVTQVRLEVGQQQNLKIKLQMQAAQTTIEISAADAGPQVNTTSSLVDGVISSQQIDSLPLNGRNFMELSLLVPGNAPAPNFDPTKSRHRGDLDRRPIGARRQCHHRWRRQQRRHRRRHAAQRAGRRGAGIPDRLQPVLGGAGTLRLGGGERGHQVGDQCLSRYGCDFRARPEPASVVTAGRSFARDSAVSPRAICRIGGRARSSRTRPGSTRRSSIAIRWAVSW